MQSTQASTQRTAICLFSTFKPKMSARQVPTIQTLVDRNKTYAQTHKPLPPLMGEDGKPRPNPGVLIVTCVDPRIHPEQFLHFGGQFMGEEKPPLQMPMVRNIGGRAGRAITDIVGLDAVFGIKQVMVVHHTDCGMTYGTDEGMRKATKDRVPEKYWKEIDEWKFGEIKDLKQSVLEDIKVLKDSPFVRDEIVVRGFIFDVKDGSMEEVTLEKERL
jgi:carbonic anhydrase